MRKSRRSVTKRRSKRRSRRHSRRRSRRRSVRKFGGFDLYCLQLQKWMNKFADEHKYLSDEARYSPERMREYYKNMSYYQKCMDYIDNKKLPAAVGYYPYYAESYCNRVNGNWTTIKGKGSFCKNRRGSNKSLRKSYSTR